jgi:hypothetical protein
MRVVASILVYGALGTLAVHWKAWRHPSFMLVMWALVYA